MNQPPDVIVQAQPRPVVHLPGAVEASALEVAARALSEAAALGMARRPFVSRHLAVVHDSDRTLAEQAATAAEQLGARCALIRSGELRLTDSLQPLDTIAVLGKLYDGLICVDLATDVIERLRREAGVPVCQITPVPASLNPPGPGGTYWLQAELLQSL